MPILHEDVNELSVISNTSNSVDLKWKTPGFNSEFTGTKVYRNDVLIATLDKTKGEYIDRNVQAETSYKYKVSATYTDQYETGGVSKSVTTQSAPPPMILESLQGKATHKDVEFTWKLPKREDFKRVNIFQDGVKVGTSTGQGFSLEGLEPSKLYKFSFTITDTNNIETTEPQFLSIKTLEEPPGVIEGGDFTEEVDGDLIITWEEPTKGKIKVFVGGKEYAIVPASDRRFTIPSKDIKYNIFGDPDVYLQPISDSGTPGEVTTPPKEEPPFSAGDLIESGNGLLWYISPLILLGLSFLLFPKLRDLLINAIRNKKNESNEKPKEIERFRTDETQMKDPQDQEMKKRMEKERLERKERQEIKEKHQGKAYLEKLEKRAKERKTLDFKISDSVEPRRRAERRSREPRTPRESKRTTREPREPRRRRGDK
ncbi:hypothetical protein JFU13_29480 [Peribacillus sp. TH24]|nr:hypothetical protein [Peribacillus sp. TH24]